TLPEASPFAGLDFTQETPGRPQGRRKGWWLVVGGTGLALVLVCVALALVGRYVWVAPEARPGGLPADPFEVLLSRSRDPQGDREHLRLDLLEFRRIDPDTPHTAELAGLLHSLPWPFDNLQRERIPEPDRGSWLSEDVVAVAGEHRGRCWCPVFSLAVSPD